MYIGLIGAMEEEILFLSSKLENQEIKVVNNTTFKIGCLYGKKVILCICGEGKVNSSICTQIMISNFDLSCIINIGVAGSISNNVKTSNIVIASSVAQHDYDITALNYERGLVLGIDKKYIETSIKSSEIYNYLKENNENVHYASIASGDIFVSDSKDIEDIKNNFDVVAIDMESGAIGHVCLYNNVDFICIRAISDGLDSNEFRIFLSNAINSLDNIINIVLSKLDI